MPLGPVWEELEQARAAQPTQLASIDEMFREHLLGGSWQVSRTGRVVYGLQSVARPHTSVEALAKHFRLPKSAAFEYNIYGQELSAHLSQLWRRRMHHLSEHWVAKGKPESYPVVSSLPSFVVPEDLQASMQSCQGRSARRRDAILQLLPASVSAAQ